MHGQKKTKLILIQCARCRKWQAVRMDPEDLERHANGMFVQFAFTDRNGEPHPRRKRARAADFEPMWPMLGTVLPERSARLFVNPLAYN